MPVCGLFALNYTRRERMRAIVIERLRSTTSMMSIAPSRIPSSHCQSLVNSSPRAFSCPATLTQLATKATYYWQLLNLVASQPSTTLPDFCSFCRSSFHRQRSHYTLKEHNTHTRCTLLSFNAVRWAWLQQIASTWRLASYLTSPWEAGIVRPITGMESKSVRIPCNKNLPIASRCAAYYGCSTFISKWNAFVALRSHTLYTCRVLYVPAGCSVC